ncbi:MAG: ferrous iron transporter B, partial [Gemmatimonadetes bacterium]|nr:ferrous iron transporter B [Gemmatimonadota bacterium]
NAGKSTLFNRLTGLRQKVANYPGVTVERRVGEARLRTGGRVDIVDLPGIYGLSAGSLDERIARDAITGTLPGLAKPDAIVLILDATQLSRHLVLASSVLELLDVPALVVLNMADELERGRGGVDTAALEERLEVPVTLASAQRNEGLEPLQVFLECVAAGQGVRIPGSRAPETRVRRLPVIQSAPERRAWAHDVGDGARYRAPATSPWTARLDGLLLHPVLGPLAFLAMVVLVFQSIFTLATPLMDGVEAVIAGSGEWIAAMLPDTWVRELLIDGIWLGVGSVLVFLPQILILFLFIGLLEDSGYMARAALMADRFMRRIGLQGKSFLPLMSSYACAVPSILAARTIDNERDRLATIFVAPFMTCSARLPIYALLIAAFIPEQPLLGPLLGTRAATLLGLYALGLGAAILTAWLLKSTVLKGSTSEFALELPPYRIPTLRSLAVRLMDRSKVFLKRAGTIILGTSIVLWTLTRIPPLPLGGPPPLDESALGQVGHLVEPLVEPLGFDWKVAVGIVSSLAAREVIVGTLGTLYGVEDATEESLQLQAALQRDLTLGGAVALLIFYVFALQCMSTVAVMRRETGGWKWPLVQWTYMLLLAWVGAFVAYRLL